jgi:Bardet-Biedl syndrome 7 protein
MSEPSIENFIKLVEPKLQFYNDLTKNHTILQALLDLNVQNDDEFDLLSDNYKDLVLNKQSLEENFKREASNLDRLTAILIDFYIDKNKFKGVNVRNKLETLQEALADCKTEALMEIFGVTEDKNEN